MKNIFLVNFILLHGYSLDNSSLMFGKMGYSLILFEYSHYFKDALAEKHAIARGTSFSYEKQYI